MAVCRTGIFKTGFREDVVCLYLYVVRMVSLACPVLRVAVSEKGTARIVIFGDVYVCLCMYMYGNCEAVDSEDDMKYVARCDKYVAIKYNKINMLRVVCVVCSMLSIQFMPSVLRMRFSLCVLCVECLL